MAGALVEAFAQVSPRFMEVTRVAECGAAWKWVPPAMQVETAHETVARFELKKGETWPIPVFWLEGMAEVVGFGALVEHAAITKDRVPKRMPMKTVGADLRP